MAATRTARATPRSFTDADLARLQKNTFRYFWEETNPQNGLIADNTLPGNVPASIAGVGLTLASYCVGVERSWVTRGDAARRVLTTLRFFRSAPHSDAPDATGYRGFYYHFLDVASGRRVWRCELSTMDTAILIAGALTAAAYFDKATRTETEIRQLADELSRRVDWQWALNGGAAVSHGWRPENGFIRYRWQGYNEALLLYVLGLGAPEHPLPAESYAAWTSTYRWKKIYGVELLHGSALFMHQLSHLWLDLRGIQDAFMREKGIDYFENSRRAVLVQQLYAMRNPKRFMGYGEHGWGITASNGPGPATRRIKGSTRRFLGYAARGVPYGPDDGTLAPWVVAAALPFAPDLVRTTLRSFQTAYRTENKYGLVCSINPTFPARSRRGWISRNHFALDQGPVVLMIENFRSGLIWQLMRECPPVVRGLTRAGFSGGWLGGSGGSRQTGGSGGAGGSGSR
jgi:hypothetical protein